MDMSETSALPRVQVRRDRSKPIIQQHPWIFSGAITHVDGDPQPGDIVRVESADGQYLATGYWNQRSQIQVRILTWRDESIDDAWWIAHIARAVAARHQDARIASGALDAYRVINAESDYLPGLIVDRYAGHLVLQALTYAIDARKAAIADALVQAFATHGVSIASVYERSDIDVRRKEGLREVTGSLIGETPAHVEVR
jgi:23S rRNA (cytosine1962-C5)-methyltransferase